MHRSHSRKYLPNCDRFLYAFHTRILAFFDGIIIQALPKTELKMKKYFAIKNRSAAGTVLLIPIFDETDKKMRRSLLPRRAVFCRMAD
jgi:hypothetical protein